jgi:hypothetical protein
MKTWDDTQNGGTGAWMDGDLATWNVAVGSSSTGGSFSWSYDKPGLAWGNNTRYRINVRVQDLANNYEAAWTTATFKCDVSSPTIAVTAPADGAIIASLPTISGRARDPETSIPLIKARIRRISDNNYWSSSGWQSSPLWINVTGSGSGFIDWYYTHSRFTNVDDPAFESGRTYVIDIQAQDNVLPSPNITTHYSTCTFTYDNLGPTSRISQPVDGDAYLNLGAITGTSFDATAGPKKVEISVLDQDAGTPTYFFDDGSSKGWQAGIPEYWITIAT